MGFTVRMRSVKVYVVTIPFVLVYGLGDANAAYREVYVQNAEPDAELDAELDAVVDAESCALVVATKERSATRACCGAIFAGPSDRRA